MTYNEFCSKEHLREIAKSPGYFITSKGRVYSDFSKRYLTVDAEGCCTLWINNKHRRFKVLFEMLKAFPDVEFTQSQIKRISKTGKNHRMRGVYSFPSSIKKYRAVISYNNKKITLGYFKTKQEAFNVFYLAFCELKQFRPW